MDLKRHKGLFQLHTAALGVNGFVPQAAPPAEASPPPSNSRQCRAAVGSGEATIANVVCATGHWGLFFPVISARPVVHYLFQEVMTGRGKDAHMICVLRNPMALAVLIMAVLAPGQLGASPGPATATAADAVSSTTVSAAAFFDSEGVKIHYIDEGKGSAVILLHGFTSSLRSWRRMGTISLLAQSRRVVALDARGHGESDKPHDEAAYGLEMARDVIRLMDHLGIERAHLIDYSMGSMISMKLITQWPERFRSAILGGYGYLPPAPGGEARRRKAAEDLRAGKGFGDFFDFLTPQKGGKASGARDLAASVFLAASDKEALAACLLGFGQLEASKEEIQAVRVPTLGLVGRQDGFFIGSTLLLKMIPNYQRVELRGNHITALFDPQFNAALIPFLESVEAEKPR